MTTMPAILDKSVVRSSVIPSTKYCWSGWLLRLAKGRTTIDRRGAERGCATDVAAATAGFGGSGDRDPGGERARHRDERHIRQRQIGYGLGAQRIDPHGASDIFDALL